MASDWLSRFQRSHDRSRTGAHRSGAQCVAATTWWLRAWAAAVLLASGLLSVRPLEAAEPPATPGEATEERQNPEADVPDEEPLEHPFPNRIPAPSLSGGVDWLNSEGPLDLPDLKGKFVLLDFWTYCCINCMHILPELKKLEQAYPGEIVVIGVHSAKFDTEQESKNITEAILRYEIEHPVVNDANHAIWNKFRINSWPSLRIIDPEGNLIAGHSGEVEFADLQRFFEAAIPYYREAGLLDRAPVRFDLERYSAEATPLRFPGKVLADEASNRLFIADSNHNRIVVASLEGQVRQTIGSGQIGAADGDFASATFDHPQGMVLDQGRWLYVADTENHLLRKIDLEQGQVATIAGLGEQGRMAWPGVDFEAYRQRGELPERFVGPPRQTALNSPWALWIHDQALYVAMAGPHQIWRMPLDESEIGPYAGNGREDIVDGPLLPREPYQAGFASFAQPSGLASDGRRLFVADSEGSSIRAVPFDPAGAVTTLLGTSHLPAGRLFTFGDRDGAAAQVQLQHPLGVVWYRERLYIADTYNNKIKEFDLAGSTVRTIAGTGEAGRGDAPARFDEPAGIAAAAGKLFVADTNNHLVRVIHLDQGNQVSTLELSGLPAPARADASALFELSAGESAVDQAVVRVPAVLPPTADSLSVEVRLGFPTGWKLNDRAPLRYQVEPVEEGDTPGPPPQKVDPPAAQFSLAIPLAADQAGPIRLVVEYYYCRDGGEGLCKLGSAQWLLELERSAEGSDRPLVLEHRTTD